MTTQTLSPAAIALNRFGLGARPGDTTGSDSPASTRHPGRRGLDEDLGREIIELHTLGVRSGYAALRAPLLKDGGGTKLDGMFTLHLALVETAKMYGQRQALFVHALASPYRDRSHFDGQNVLETGGTAPYALADGWLNRLVALMPRSTDAAIAIAPTVPMALRGPAQVSSYAPSALPAVSDDLMTRVSALYDADPQLHPLWASALDAKGLAAGTTPGHDPASLGTLTAGFLTKPNGPRIAMLETVGWDTHSGQTGRLATQLKGLDALLAGLRDGLGPAWAQTTVLVATEFRRTAAANGAGGTDHGTGAVAMLVGGAVKGGRVFADWPGLAPAQLYQQRDLRPTTALDALIAGTVAEGLALDPAASPASFRWPDVRCPASFWPERKPPVRPNRCSDGFRYEPR